MRLDMAYGGRGAVGGDGMPKRRAPHARRHGPSSAREETSSNLVLIPVFFFFEGVGVFLKYLPVVLNIVKLIKAFKYSGGG